MATPELWRVVGSSVRGAGHLKSDLPCQDAHGWEVLDSGWLLAATADGAGSAQAAEVGARTACRVALGFLRNEFPVRDDLLSLLREGARVAREAIAAEADRVHLPARELACTLTLAAASSNEAGAVQIGDGAALLLLPSGEMQALTTPPESEYLNETLFLTGENALEELQAVRVSTPIRGLALLTDGLQMLALQMPGRTPHKPFFDPLFRFLASEKNEAARQAQMDKFLQSPRIAQRTDDDLTLLMATLP